MRVLRVHVSQVSQNFDLYDPLLLEAFLVPNELDGYMDSFFVVVAFGDLPKGAFSKERENFIAVPNVIVFSEIVVSPRVVVAFQCSMSSVAGKGQGSQYYHG